MNNYVKLKDFFISRKIPKEQRRHIPLLTSNKDIMWVVGHRIDERYKVTEQSKNVMQVAAEPY
jgi:tRNA(Ile)-lysidine synthase